MLGNRLNGFPSDFAFAGTWLKPGVNEIKPAAIVSEGEVHQGTVSFSVSPHTDRQGVASDGEPGLCLKSSIDEAFSG
jgi:hypothetical protein